MIMPAYRHIPTMTNSHHGGFLSVMIMVGICQWQNPTIDEDDEELQDEDEEKDSSNTLKIFWNSAFIFSPDIRTMKILQELTKNTSTRVGGNENF